MRSRNGCLRRYIPRLCHLWVWALSALSKRNKPGSRRMRASSRGGSKSLAAACREWMCCGWMLASSPSRTSSTSSVASRCWRHIEEDEGVYRGDEGVIGQLRNAARPGGRTARHGAPASPGFGAMRRGARPPPTLYTPGAGLEVEHQRLGSHSHHLVRDARPGRDAGLPLAPAALP
jgi:hypothetical protein